MDLIDYLPTRDIEFAKHRIKEGSLNTYEKLINCTFGDQVKRYLLDLGFVNYRTVEIYGITADLGGDSDMIKTTKRLQKSFPVLNGLIAVENQGDGDYYLVDQNDQMHRFLIATKEVIDLHMSFEDYVISRMYI